MKRYNKKPKLLYLLKMLWEETDEEHGLSMPQIINRLFDQGIFAERKSIYDDIDCLRQYGYDIKGEQDESGYSYKLVERDFNISELKLLADALHSSRFASESKLLALTKKLQAQTSVYHAAELKRSLYHPRRAGKTFNGSYINLDRLEEAMSLNCQVSFYPLHWTPRGRLEASKTKCTVSPWEIVWAGEEYYLIAYEEKAEMIKAFRLDKIRKVTIIVKKREGKLSFVKFDLGTFAKKMFGESGGEKTRVTLEYDRQAADMVFDRLGEIDGNKIEETSDGRFTVEAEVCLSKEFLAWGMAHGDKVKIIAPTAAVEMIKEELARLNKLYGA